MDFNLIGPLESKSYGIWSWAVTVLMKQQTGKSVHHRHSLQCILPVSYTHLDVYKRQQ